MLPWSLVIIVPSDNDLFDTWEERELVGSFRECDLFYRSFELIYVVCICSLAFHLKQSPSSDSFNIYLRNKSSRIAK